MPFHTARVRRAAHLVALVILVLSVARIGGVQPSAARSAGAAARSAERAPSPAKIQAVPARAEPADLQISKTDGLATVNAGAQLTYTIVVSNAGPVAVIYDADRPNFIVSDIFPAQLTGITWNCTASAGSSCVPASGAGNMDLVGGLEVGGTLTILVTATVRSDASGTLINTAQVRLPADVCGDGCPNPYTDPDLTNNSATDTTAIIASADLAISKSDSPDPVYVGAALTYSLVVSNTGPGMASAITMTDTLPAGVTFVSATPSQGSCAESAGTVTCVAGGLIESPTSILLVNGFSDDPSQPFYAAALGNLGYGYDVYDVLAAGAEPDLATLQQYDIVIWFDASACCYDDGAGPSEAAEAVLDSYLQGGGRLLISGQDYAFDGDAGITPSAFMSNTLGIAAISDDTGATTISGLNAFAGLGPYATNFPFEDYSDTLTPNANGVAAFASENGTAGVASAGGRTIYLAFAWEAVANADAANGEAMLDAMLRHLGAVAPIDNRLAPGETVTVQIVVRPTAPGLITNTASVTGSINDPNPANNSASATTLVVQAQMTISDVARSEGNAGTTLFTFTVSLDRAAPVEVSADYATADGTAGAPGDYAAASGQIVFLPGATSATITVAVNGDTDNELTETFVVNLGKPTNAALADGQGLGTIINDEIGSGAAAIYMPLLVKSGAPNLIGSFSLSPARTTFVAGEPVTVTAVITNVGTAPAGPFWADFYINPAERPSVNRKWYDICSTNPCFGIAWAIRQTLAPGQSVTVTSTIESYSPGHTIWNGWLPGGTTDLYLLVDSWNAGNPLAAVAESNENDNLSELHGLTVSGPSPRLPASATRLPAAPRRLDR